MPFFAVVDFDGRLAAAPLGTGFHAVKPGVFAGRINLGGKDLHFRFNVAPHSNEPTVPAMEFHSRPRLEVIRPPPKPEAISAIRHLQHNLAVGNSYLVNYCSQSIVSVDAPISSLYIQSTAPYTVWLEDQFLAFSPEAFITAMENRISTTPMKGTGFDATALLADPKEQAEHATVVDLLRNDLGRVARDIALGDYRYLTEIRQAGPRQNDFPVSAGPETSLIPGGRTLYQTSTEIHGTLPADWQSHIGEWLPKLLPAGSVTGAPKAETVELIRRFEAEPRGFFTGVAVLFDGDSLYSCVLIRFLDLAGDVLKFRSGAGITIYSDAEQEYAEILSKVYIPV